MLLAVGLILLVGGTIFAAQAGPGESQLFLTPSLIPIAPPASPSEPTG